MGSWVIIEVLAKVSTFVHEIIAQFILTRPTGCLDVLGSSNPLPCPKNRLGARAMAGRKGWNVRSGVVFMEKSGLGRYLRKD